MKLTHLTLFLLVGGLSLSSCKKEGCTDENATNYSEEAKKDDGTCTYNEHDHDHDHDHGHGEDEGTVEVFVDYNWGMSGEEFILNSTLVHPMTGDSLTFTTFKYYISNFKLKNEDGEWWSHPESYFLVDLGDGLDNAISLEGVPEGTYTEMSYILGVDSERNTSGAQEGALSVSNNMFWSWSSGYIMLKAEGTSPQSETGSFSFHLGGFEGDNNIVTTKEVVFGAENLTIADDHTSEVHLIANPARLWHSSPSVSTTHMTHMPGTTAVTMAGDFYSNVSFDYVENN